LWSFELDAGNNVINHTTRTADLDPPGTDAITGPSSFGEDACGEIYICDHDDGEIYQIVPEQVCQADLGFQGKGPGRMTMCGGDLSTGTTADMIVCPLTPGSQMLLLGGTTNLPTQVWEVGSMLVPIPPLFAIGMAAPSESLVLPITGGGGPGSLFVQWVIQDPAATSPTGWYATNALRIDFLP
jgi:hypothetical protein